MSSDFALGELAFSIPEAWKVERADSQPEGAEVVLSFSAPLVGGAPLLSPKPEKTFKSSVLIEFGQHPEAIVLENFVAQRVANFTKAQPSAQLISQAATLVAGWPAIAREQRFSGPGKLLYQQRLVYLAHGRSTWVIGTTHLAGGQFEATRSAVDAFLSSIAHEK